MERFRINRTVVISLAANMTQRTTPCQPSGTIRILMISLKEVATQVERSLGVLNEVGTEVIHAVQNRPLP